MDDIQTDLEEEDLVATTDSPGSEEASQFSDLTEEQKGDSSLSRLSVIRHLGCSIYARVARTRIFRWGVAFATVFAAGRICLRIKRRLAGTVA